MSTASPNSYVYRHADHPEWGRGIVLPAAAGRMDRLDLSFETGGRRILMKTFASKLTVVDMPEAEADVLREKLAARRASNTPIVTKKKKPGAAKSPVAVPDFEAQLALFKKLFPEGFQAVQFERAEEKPTGPAAKPKRVLAVHSVALAKKSFAPAAFSSDVPFTAAAELAKSSGLVHPLDGAALLGTVTEADRPKFLAALKSLLHGTESEATRFDGFVTALTEIAGAGAKRPSWPLATMFAALSDPTNQVCVKPTAFRLQAAMLKLPLDYTPAPSFAVYEQFLAVAKATEKALKDAGEQPRDLLDVHTFISATHGAKVPEKPVVPAATA